MSLRSVILHYLTWFGLFTPTYLIHLTVNKAARLVIHHCIKHHIGTVVFGWSRKHNAESRDTT
ncbi:MAG: hypothetical protein QNJ36_11810, partial [Calothrix sp. MO_167.B42]|nr:hypothetical protein [Calothrix sp. MO_167.B42]